MKLLVEHNEVQHEIDLPFLTEEMLYTDFVDATKCLERYINSVASQEEEEEPEEIVISEVLPEQSIEKEESKLLSPVESWEAKGKIYDNIFHFVAHSFQMGMHKEDEKFTTAVLDATSKLVKGDLSTFTVHFEDDNLLEMILSGDVPLDQGVSISRLFAHLANVISSFHSEPPEVSARYKFDYKDETYYIDPLETKNVLFKRQCTVNEVFAILELDKVFSQKIAEKGDPYGQHDFEMTLCLISVIARKFHENLPTDTMQRQRFIIERGGHFQKLPLNIVLEVRFFLRNIIIEYVRTHFLQATSVSPLLADLKGKIRKGLNYPRIQQHIVKPELPKFTNYQETKLKFSPQLKNGGLKVRR